MSYDSKFRHLDDEECRTGAKVGAGAIALGAILCFTPAAPFGAWLISGGIGIGASALTGCAPKKPNHRRPL